MDYNNFTTFNVKIDEAIAWVTFDFLQSTFKGCPCWQILTICPKKLEVDRNVKVVVFQLSLPLKTEP